MKISLKLIGLALVCEIHTVIAAPDVSTVVERGPHHRLSERVTQVKLPDGRVIEQKSRQVDLLTGLHYRDGDSWAESQELIEPHPDGAVAHHGQHKAAFAANLNTRGAIQVVDADGNRFTSHVLGLAFTDAASGQSVLLAQVKDSSGQIVPLNQIVYADAFSGLKADVRYTYRRNGIEQDIIIREKLPVSPADFGFDPATTRLEVFTEFIEAPAGIASTEVLREESDPTQRQGMSIPDFVDQQLNFGAMGIGKGKAVDLQGVLNADVPVGKTWEIRDGRTILIEAVEFSTLQPALDQLPANVGAPKKEARLRPTRLGTKQQVVARPFPSSPRQRAAVDRKPMRQTAQLNLKPGVLLDYDMELISGRTNLTFELGVTYRVLGPVQLYGTTTIMPATVVKYASESQNAYVALNGSVVCNTTPYRPAVFTALDDDSIGTQVSEGALGGYYAMAALRASTTVTGEIHDLRFNFANTAIDWNGSTQRFSNLQFMNCSNAIRRISAATNEAHNILATNVINLFVGSNTTINAQHVTAHLIGTLSRLSGTPSKLTLTNCVLVNVTNLGTNTITGDYLGTNGTPAIGGVTHGVAPALPIFQTSVGGHYYLTNNSTLRNTGTLNIASTLLSEISRATTYAPLYFTDAIATNAVFSVLAFRDTNTPDLGYHYAPLDYIVSHCVIRSNAMLFLTNGVGIGVDYSVSDASGSWGFVFASGGLLSVGSPTQMNTIVRAHCVQETSTGNPGTQAMFYDYSAGDPTQGNSTMRFRFTQFAHMVEDGYMFYGGSYWKQLEWTHCDLFNAGLGIGGNSGQGIGFTNNVWERSGAWLAPSGLGYVHAHNNTMRESYFSLTGGNTNWTVQDNLFDIMVQLSDNGSAVSNSYNAYYPSNTMLSGGASNLLLASVSYGAGALGRFYQPTNSPLINAGSRNATNAGLYHFTTTTNQWPETNSIVDIGYHYVALNAQGQPLDSNTNGIPNYIEDANGDGFINNGESAFTSLSVSITAPPSGTNFNAPAAITFAASASAPHSPITLVEYFNGGISIGQTTTAPYTFNWSSVPAGIYTITARATALAGLMATSAPVTIYVNNALFIWGGSSTLGNDDAVTNRLRQWGYYPRMMADTQAVASVDGVGKGLVFISRSATSANIDTNFATLAVPIISRQDQFFNDLNMTGPTHGTDYNTSNNNANIYVSLTNHPMGTNFIGVTSFGTNTVLSWGKPNTNAVAVAFIVNGTGADTNKATIFGYESNSWMFNNFRAPSRRVGFTYAGTNVNANGWALLSNAVLWATGTNSPPSLSWISPTNGTKGTGGTNFTLIANAADWDSGMKKVSFYDNAVRIGIANTLTNGTNFSLAWSNIPGGEHFVTAKAFDNGDFVTTSTQLIDLVIKTNILLVGNSATLNASDAAISNRLGSNGFVVTVKAQTSAAVSDANGKSLVLLSGSVTATNVSNIFTKISVPLITWQSDLFDDLGMTGTNATNFGTTAGQTDISFTAATNSNPLLSANFAGTITVVSNSTNFTWAIPGSNAVKIATITTNSSKTVVFGYDKGKLMVGLGTNQFAAPARRVGFLLTSNNAASLNGNGWKLFDGAVGWAMQKPCYPSVDVILAIDNSQSMVTNNALGDAKNAAINFINLMNLSTDQVGIVYFATTSTVAQVLTHSSTSAVAAVNAINVSATGGTIMNYAVQAAQNELLSTNHNTNSQMVMILLTDGLPTNGSSNNTVNAATAAKDSGIRIFTVGIGAADANLMTTLASTPSDYFFTPNSSELADLYNAVSDSLCYQIQPPSVAIINPTNGAVFNYPANVQIDASASDAGSILSVTFYAGTNRIGVVSNAPYSLPWTNPAGGLYSLTAVALNNSGITATSTAVAITINLAPIVSINDPTNNSVFPLSPTNITISASATDDGTIALVEFYSGTNKIGQDSTSPYSIVWSNVDDGTYALTAKATDNYGVSTTSSAVNITLQGAPIVSILVPTNGQSLVWSPTNISITATARSLLHSISYVQFFETNGSIGVAFSAPYTNNWQPVFGGLHTLKARAVDSTGRAATSGPVTVSVNFAPTVTLTLPTNGTLFTIPQTNIGLAATAADFDGTVTQVQFFSGTNLLGVDTTSPYSNYWVNVSPGIYHLFARATDNQGAQANSPGITVTVLPTNAPPVVIAGASQTNRLTNSVQLNGIVTDDGLPSGILTSYWRQASGPGNVIFNSSTNPVTLASFTTNGVYQLQLIASDGQYSATGLVSITVLPQNTAPTVSAGIDQFVVLPGPDRFPTNFDVSFSPVFTNVTTLIGIDYVAPSNSLVAAYYSTNTVVLISTNAVASIHYALSNANDDYAEFLPLAARVATAGWNVGDTFLGSTNAGTIVRIAPDHGVTSPWITLTNGIHGEAYPFRGALCIDQTGIFSNDMIAVSQAGNVWRISTNKQVTWLAGIVTDGAQPAYLHSVVVAPNDALRYGPLAGKIVAAPIHGPGPNGPQFPIDHNLYAIDVNGMVTRYAMPSLIGGVCKLDIVPAFENCFACDSHIYKAPYNSFLAYVGDIMAFGEGQASYRVLWNGVTLTNQQLISDFGPDFEGATFAPIDFKTPVLPIVNLTGSVTDDGLPGGVTNVLWTQVSGPQVHFTSSTTRTNSTARLTESGQYVFRLTADDGELTNFDEVTVTVVQNEAPFVFAGFNQTNSINQFFLSGTVSDDGFPSNYLSTGWSVVSTPAGGQVSFESTNSPQTFATFTKAGDYQLRLTASDGQATAASDVVITVSPLAVLTLSPSNAVQYLRWSTHSFQATLLTSGGAPIQGSNVQFIVEGANPRQFSTNTDSSGHATLAYGGANPGVDTITAFTVKDGIAVVSPPTWVTWVRYPVLVCGEDITFDLPSGGSYTNRYEMDLSGGTEVTLSLTESGDPATGVLRNIDGTSLTFDEGHFDVSSNGTYWLDVGVLPGDVGTYHLVIDCAGNGGWDPDAPASITILSPANHAVFERSPAQIAIHASASDTAEITSVEVFTNSIFAGYASDQFPNFYFDLQNLDPGTYKLQMTAHSAEHSSTSSVVTVLITNRPDLHLYLGSTEQQNHGSLDLGVTTVLTSVVQTLTISNLGSAPLHLLQISNSGDFTLTLSSTSLIPVNASATLDVRFNASAWGHGIGVLALYSDDGDFGNGIQNPFLLNLTATANATGSPPVVVITNPVSGTTFTAPASIPIVATASSSGSSIAKVEYFVSGSTSAKIGRVENGSNPFSMTWNNVAPGNYSITAVASDLYGRTTRSAPVSITVISNHPPQALQDSYIVLVNTTQNLFNVLTNDSDLDSDDLRIVSISVTNYGTPIIVNDGKAIQYIPQPNTYGTDGFKYVVSDGRGGTASAWVVVKIEIPLPQTVAVSLSPTPGPYTGGTTLTITASPSSQGSVTGVDFLENGRLIGSVANAPYALSWDAIVGTTNITAIAYDTLGRSGQGSVALTVNPVTGDAHPVATFTNLTNQIATVGSTLVTNQIAVVRDGVFVLKGSAYDQDGHTTKYKLRLRRADGTLIRDLAPNWIVGAVTNGPLLTNDFTMLRNDVYQMELLVSAGGREASTNITFALESELKIGQFSFSQQDMVIPVNGLPLSVIRTYSTLNPNSGDFGNSWTYSIHDLEMTIDEDRADTADVEDDAGEPQLFSMRVGGGRDVTLTLPDGRRTTFAFYLEPGNCNPGDDAQFCAFAKWAAPSDVYYTLTPLGDNKLISLFGNLWWAADSGVSYENFDFPGFLLTAPDGTQYRLDREDFGEHWFFGDMADGNSVHAYGKGTLTRITQRTGDTISISPNAIVHTNAAGALTRTVTFQRDPVSGRITSIIDPNSTTNTPAVKYDYDYYGNLVHVSKLTDLATATYETTTFVYGNPNFPSYITEIRDPRGISPMRTLYDSSGRMIGTVDAFGFTNRIDHGITQNLTNNYEVVWDRSGHSTTHYFDSRGNVTATIDALGKATYRTYDASNNLASMTDSLSNTTFYAYDAVGNRTKVVDALVRTNYFTYDTNGNLLTQTDPLGNVTSNRYDNAGLLTNSAHFDAQGQIVDQTSYFYSGGQLVETHNFSNQVVSAFGYDTKGNLTNTTDANGFSRGFGYDANGNQTSSYYVWAGPGGNVTVSTATAFDASGRVTQTIDANGNTNRTFYNGIGKVAYSIDKFGNTNNFQYDARGNLIETKYPDGTITRTVYDNEARPFVTTDRNGVTGTKITYDDVGRTLSSIRLKNVRVTIVADANNAGQVMSVVSAAGIPISTNSTEYFDNGWVKSRTGPEGKKTTYEYWADGHVKTVTDPFTNTTFYSYDDAGRQTLVRDALMNETQFVYDALGRMVKTVYADTTYGSNVFNNLGQRIGQVDQAGLLTKFDYTLAGQLKTVTKPSVTDPQNPAQTVSPKWSYDYDAYGRLSVMTDPKGRTNNLAYDAVGRQLTHRLPMGQTETNIYNAFGQLWKKIDFKNQKTEFMYDNFGRVKAKFYFHAGASAPSNAVCYQYNSLGQLAKIVERSGADASTNACDGYAVLVGFHDNQTRWAVVTRVASQGASSLVMLALIGIAWSRVPRPVKKGLIEFYLRGGWHLSNIPEPTARRLRLPSLWWRFVTLVVLVALIGTDQHFSKLFEARAQCVYPPNTSTETTRITEFSYDFEGRLAQVNAPEGVINYGYDLATGRHISTCTTNSEIAYGYDELGRLKTVTALKRNGTTLSTPEVTTYTYTKVGSRETVTLPNGIVTTWRYDNLNRLTNLTHKIGTTNLASYVYQLHATGRRTNAIEVLKQEDGSYLTNTLVWQYDGMYRLTNEISASSLSAGTFSTLYQYDEVGNRLKKIRSSASSDTTDYTYNDNDQLLQEVSTLNGTINYAYDANGSLTGKTNGSGTVTYDYNLMNKMRAVTASGVTTTFLYNDSGIRVRSMTGSSSTHYLIDANNHTGYAQILEELSTPGASPTRSYVIGDDVLAQCGTTATAPSYFLYDGHGSTRQLTSTNAIVTSRYNYDSYGATLASSSTTPETSLLYCGEQLDSTLGMYNLRARFYDAFNGRFNQKDLFEGDAFTPQSLHRYAYAHLDPVTEQDPSGESVEGTLVITALLLVVLLFVLDTPPRPTIRPLNSQEQAQVDRVLNGMASYDRLGRVKHHVTALRLREYRVDFSLKHEKPTDADTQGYTYPSREPNRIYLAPFIFTDTTFNEFSIDWTVTFSGHLMDVMVHEDLHLELGKSDPSGAYVDQVADLANGPYLKTMHSQMAAERKNLNRR